MVRPKYVECPYGHDYDKEVKRKGVTIRVCRTCANAANRRYRLRKRIEQLTKELEEENKR
jgi:hypothetical protein